MLCFHSILLCVSHTHTHSPTILETGRPEVLFPADLVAMEESRCDCGSLYERVLHRFIYLDIWFPTGRAIWGHLGGMASLEEVCLRGQDLRAPGLALFVVCFLSLSTLCLCLRYDPSVCCSAAYCHTPLPGSSTTLLKHKPK